MSGSLSWVIVGASTGVEGVVCITVVAETLMHQDHGALPTSLWLLVDQHVPIGVLQGRALVGVELALARQ